MWPGMQVMTFLRALTSQNKLVHGYYSINSLTKPAGASGAGKSSLRARCCLWQSGRLFCTVHSSSMSIQIEIAANRNRDPRDRGKKRKTVVAKEAFDGTNILPAKAEPES